MTPLFFNQLVYGKKITAGSILRPSALEIEESSHSTVDGAFPMRTWIMKPYGDAILNEQKRYLNGNRGCFWETKMTLEGIK